MQKSQPHPDQNLDHAGHRALGRRAGATSKLSISLAFVALATLGCTANAPTRTPESYAADRQAALATAVAMPAATQFEARYFEWQDTERQRAVATKLYLPTADGKAGVPLVVFSHGIGGSREGYSYLGQYLAANGVASLHLQHAGSDRSVWSGSPINMVTRLQAAAQDGEAINRVQDMSFALTKLMAVPELVSKLDPSRIVAAGHSYGANTTMLAVGAQVDRASQLAPKLKDSRFKAAIIISAPPFYGENNLGPILGGIQVPSLHITATEDDIQIPGYYSPAKDRVAVYEAMGGPGKALAVFTGGSHSMFTDRLGTGGVQLNPKVKVATRELTLAFVRTVFDAQSQAMHTWQGQNAGLLSRYEPLKP